MRPPEAAWAPPARMPYPRRRKPAGRPEATVAERILALFQASPEAVIGRGAVAAHMGSKHGREIDVPLTSLINNGALIELKAGFCLATAANTLRLKAEMAARPVVRLPSPLPERARSIVSKAHQLRQEGWVGRAVDLLERAARLTQCPRIACNFRVLAELFAFGDGCYRDVTRREALAIAAAAGRGGDCKP